MIEITEHDRFYWQYEYDVVAKYLLPLFRQWGVNTQGAALLDVGCGDGGGLAAFHDGGMDCKGFDVEPRRVELAHEMSNGRRMDLRVGNIYLNPPPFADRKFDLVVLHDVFEHLDHKDEVLRTLGSYLAPGGKLAITFPPYYSAYGGHQQLMRTWFAAVPFVHLLPFMVSFVVPNLKKEDRVIVDEIRKLDRLRMGMRKFERLLPGARLQLEAKRGYLISPNHIRFGLKPMSSGIVKYLPLIREVFTSGVVYLLARS